MFTTTPYTIFFFAKTDITCVYVVELFHTHQVRRVTSQLPVELEDVNTRRYEVRALRNQKDFKSSRYGQWKNLHSSSKTCLTGTKVRTSIRSVA